MSIGAAAGLAGAMGGGAAGLGGMGAGLGGFLEFMKANPISIATDKFAMNLGGQPVDKSGFDTTEMASWMEQLKAMMEGVKQGKGTEGGPQAGFMMTEAKRVAPSPYYSGSADAVGGPMFGVGGPPINPITARRVVAPPQAFEDPFGSTAAPMTPQQLKYGGGY